MANVKPKAIGVTFGPPKEADGEIGSNTIASLDAIDRFNNALASNVPIVGDGMGFSTESGSSIVNAADLMKVQLDSTIKSVTWGVISAGGGKFLNGLNTIFSSQV